MTARGHAWVWIAHVKSSDNTVAAAFIVDERRYPDPDAAQAVVDESSEVLHRLGLAYEFESVRVRDDEPAPELPSWAEYRRRVLEPPHGGAV